MNKWREKVQDCMFLFWLFPSSSSSSSSSRSFFFSFYLFTGEGGEEEEEEAEEEGIFLSLCRIDTRLIWRRSLGFCESMQLRHVNRTGAHIGRLNQTRCSKLVTGLHPFNLFPINIESNSTHLLLFAISPHLKLYFHFLLTSFDVTNK